jgi:hypothetical protein
MSLARRDGYMTNTHMFRSRLWNRLQVRGITPHRMIIRRYVPYGRTQIHFRSGVLFPQQTSPSP